MPILRVQQSEYIALGSLDDAVADRIVPLLYQTPSSDGDDPGPVAYRRLDQLVTYWNRASFYDPRIAVAYDGLEPKPLYDAAAARGPFAPCVPLDPGSCQHAVEAAQEHGRAALRIDDPLVVLDDTVEGQIDACLSELGLGLEDVTLVFDLGESTDPRNANAVLRFPHLHQWANVVLGAGGFLHERAPTETRIPRQHLATWRNVASSAAREVTFGDYGTLEAAFIPPAAFPPAAKLVYTEPDMWLYVRGTSILRDGNEQMVELTRRVVASPHWRGADYSWGDGWIADCAAESRNPGNAGMWIRAALSHHLTHVVREDV